MDIVSTVRVKQVVACVYQVYLNDHAFYCTDVIQEMIVKK